MDATASAYPVQARLDKRARPSNSKVLILNWDVYHCRPNLVVRPIHHTHCDLRVTRTSFLRDPHGAMEGIASAPFLQQVLSAQGRSIGRFCGILNLRFQVCACRHFRGSQRVAELLLGAPGRATRHGDAEG